MQPLAVPVGQTSAGLHAGHHHTVLPHRQPGDMDGRCKGRLDRLGIAQLPVHRDIVRGLRVDRRAAGGKRQMRLQLVEVEQDRLCGIERLRAGLGHHQRQRLADVADHPVGQDGALGHHALAPALVLRRHRPHRREKPRGLEIPGAEDEGHALHPAGGLEIELGQPRMRHRRTQEHRLQRAGWLQVGQIAAVPGEKPQILAPPDALRCAECAHPCPLASCGVRISPHAARARAGVRRAGPSPYGPPARRSR